MKHSYRKIVAYNPTKNEVTAMEQIDPDRIFSQTVYAKAFHDVYDKADTSTEMVVGIGLARELYQLSPAPYSNYIKEDIETMKFIDRPKFFKAVDDFHIKNNIPYLFF